MRDEDYIKIIKDYLYKNFTYSKLLHYIKTKPLDHNLTHNTYIGAEDDNNKRLKLVNDIVDKNPLFMKSVLDCIKRKNIENELDVLNIFNDTLKLYEHQKKSLVFMKQREQVPSSNGMKGGILLLQMGLGKTIIALTHCFSCKSKNPSLVILPKTLMNEWKINAEKFFDQTLTSQILYFHTDFNESIKNFNQADFENYKIVITTYDVINKINKKLNVSEMVVPNSGFIVSPVIEKLKMGVAIHPQQQLLGNLYLYPQTILSSKISQGQPFKGEDCIFFVNWERIILDESHKIANPKSFIYRSILTLTSKFNWCLTGTPIKNKSRDLWAQARFCGYNLIAYSRKWKNNYYIEHGIKDNVLVITYQDTLSTADAITLPELTIKAIETQMNKEQRECYESLGRELKNEIEVFKKQPRAEKKKKNTHAMEIREKPKRVANMGMILAHLQHMRQICINHHIYLKKEATLEELGTEKFVAVLTLLRNITTAKEKVIVFSCFTGALRLLKVYLDVMNKKSKKSQKFGDILFLDGSITGQDRNALIDKFRFDKDSNILLSQITVGSQGLTLTEANNVIILEPWWADYLHRQAYGRVWRMGQKKACTCYVIKTEDSIENSIFDMCFKKNTITNTYFSGTVQQENIGEFKLNVAQIEKFLKNTVSVDSLKNTEAKYEYSPILVKSVSATTNTGEFTITNNNYLALNYTYLSKTCFIKRVRNNMFTSKRHSFLISLILELDKLQKETMFTGDSTKMFHSVYFNNFFANIKTVETEGLDYFENPFYAFYLLSLINVLELTLTTNWKEAEIVAPNSAVIIQKPRTPLLIYWNRTPHEQTLSDILKFNTNILTTENDLSIAGLLRLDGALYYDQEDEEYQTDEDYDEDAEEIPDFQTVLKPSNENGEDEEVFIAEDDEDEDGLVEPIEDDYDYEEKEVPISFERDRLLSDLAGIEYLTEDEEEDEDEEETEEVEFDDDDNAVVYTVED